MQENSYRFDLLSDISHKQKTKLGVKWSRSRFVIVSKLVSLLLMSSRSNKIQKLIFYFTHGDSGVLSRAHLANRYQLVLFPVHIHTKYQHSHHQRYQNTIPTFHYAKPVRCQTHIFLTSKKSWLLFAYISPHGYLNAFL